MIGASELHLHLYGCLSTEDLWAAGKDRAISSCPDRLDWYATTYEAAWGRRPDWRRYWSADDGLEQLRTDFVVTKSLTFAQFQACFNLIIALHPIKPSDDTILRLVMGRLRRQGLGFAELRTPIPPSMPLAAIPEYLTTLCRTAKELSDQTFAAHLVLSLPRGGTLSGQQYDVIKQWQAAHQDLVPWLTALDFCGDEEAHPPLKEAPFFARVRADNMADPRTALALLVHVGESFQSMTIASAIRRIHQTHRIGAHRLGHAIALGIDPLSLRGQSATETPDERRDHLNWLTEYAPDLSSAGYAVDLDEIARERNALSNAPVAVTYTETHCLAIAALQRAVGRLLAQEHAMVEVCPTSNTFLAATPGHHPLIGLTRCEGLGICLSSDDPGIFATDLRREFAFCRSLQIDENMLATWQQNAQRWTSRDLVRTL